MQELYVALRVVLAILLALGRNAAAEADCHLPEDNDILSLIDTTYTSAVTTNLTQMQYVCLASGMYRDQYRSASLLVRYTCTTPSCVRGAVVEKELLDLSCVDGEWSVATFTEDPDTEFDTPPRTDCSSCINSTEIDTFLYDATSHCIGNSK